MKWAEIEIRCSPESVDAVSDLLTEAGCGGTAIRGTDSEPGTRAAGGGDGGTGRQDDGPTGRAEVQSTMPSPRLPVSPSPRPPVSVLGYLPVDDRLEGQLSAIRLHLRKLPDFGLAVEQELTLRTVQDQDWESAWKQYFKPLRVGRHLVVKPSWEEYTPRPGDRVMELDPGMAFGTGAHPTTQLCLEALEDCVRPDDRVLDFGTGSGILALAAARLEAAEVVGVEIDPVAAAAAELNVTGNGLRDRIRIVGGDLDSLPAGASFEGIVANILAGVILDEAEPLASLCCPGGWLIASGIIENRALAVGERLCAVGFADLEIRRRGEWVALIGRRAQSE